MGRGKKREPKARFSVTVARWPGAGRCGWGAVMRWGTDPVLHVVSGCLVGDLGQFEPEQTGAIHALKALLLPSTVEVCTGDGWTGEPGDGGPELDHLVKRHQVTWQRVDSGMAWSLARKAASRRAKDGQALVRETVRAKDVGAALR